MSKKYILIVVKFHMSSHLHCSSGQNFVDINLGDKKTDIWSIKRISIYDVLKEPLVSAKKETYSPLSITK